MLFAPLSLNGKLDLRNRIVLAPLYLASDGRGELFRAFYARRAQGGVGLIVAPQSTPGGLDDWEDPAFGAAFQPLINDCHSAGARIALQIFPGGASPDEVSKDDLAAIPHLFARAAAGARSAGFDAIEVHGAHHSLFMRLLSPLQNQRSDAYGGSLENRWRAQVDTVRAIRAEVGPSFPVLYRLSATDWHSAGVGLETTTEFALVLEEAGLDCVDVSAGTLDSPPGSSFPGKDSPMGCFSHLAAAIRSVVSVPVIAVGKIATRDVAEAILGQRHADLVALGRPLIADPDWPVKLLENRDDKVIPCLWDNAGCLAKSIHVGTPIRCVQNREAGHEHETVGPPSPPKD